jgi:hypothetical protein
VPPLSMLDSILMLWQQGPQAARATGIMVAQLLQQFNGLTGTSVRDETRRMDVEKDRK